MGRSTARKVTPKHTAVGGAAPADFKGGDFELHGFWLHPNRRLTVEVPIFQHGFYPKLEHTDLDIERQIQYRMVQMPSLADLRGSGIAAEKAVFVAEVWTHPRYIKHQNYFRNDFPANIKTLAKQNDMTLVFPANDMPFARWKRKNVLAFWRAAFTPLFIQGKQFTSGRMSMFFVAPPHVSQGFRTRLNLEHDEDFNNLVEWDPVAWRLSKKIKKKKVSKPNVVFGIRDGEVSEASRKLEKDIGPLITSKLGIDPRSKEGKAIMAVIADKELSRSLLAKTRHKKDRFPAVKSWVKYTMWPRIRDFAAEEGAAIGRAVVNFAFQTTVSVAVNHMLETLVGEPLEKEDEIKAFKAKHPYRHGFQRFAGKFDYTPDQHATSTQIGAGTLSYKFKSNPRDKKFLIDLLKEKALELYTERTQDDITSIGKDFIDIKITPSDQIIATWNMGKVNRQLNKLPEAMGFFYTKDGWARSAAHHLRMVTPALNNFYQAAKMGEVE